MTGHVFHPGHEELHGVTVLVEGVSGRSWVGRYHERTARGVVLHDVASHDPAKTSVPRSDWISRLLKFGVPAETKFLVVPGEEITGITRLVEIGTSGVQ